MGELDREGVGIARGLSNHEITTETRLQECFAHEKQTSARPARESMSTPGYPQGILALTTRGQETSVAVIERRSALRDRGAGEGVGAVIQLVAAVAGDLV